MRETVRPVPSADGLRDVAGAGAAPGGGRPATVHLVFPRLPPAPDGIGDYTARLAAALAQHCAVTILTAEPHPAPIPGVAVRQAFSIERRSGVAGLRDALAHDPPDWLVLQYNPFSYGRWGLNGHLPRVVRALQRRHPAMRVALMVHEVMPPLLNARLALMSTWQLAQLWRLGRAADLAFAAIEPWVDPFARWFGTTPVRHLPVGSNIPYRPASRDEARCRLGIGDPTTVLGVFGTAHPTRLLGFVRAAAETLRRETDDLLVLYVGPDGAALRRALDGLPLHDAGRVPPDDVSPCFAAMDLYLAPFRGGVSTRRGSFVTALQHGVATVSTVGRQTGRLLRAADGRAFLLAPDDDPALFCRHARALLRDPARRAETARAGQELFRTTFGWDVIAARLLAALAHPAPSEPAP